MKNEPNIEFINETLKFIVKRLNDKKIDFYIVGAIGAYIDAQLPIERNHEDIDIMIEEIFVNELKDIFKDSNFIFYDNRFSSTKILNEHGYTEGEHEVYAQHKNINFHIGFFLFQNNDDSYTVIDYFRENGIQKKLERTLPIELFKAQYNDKTKNYLGMRLKVVRKETIYKNKLVMNRDKDLFDIEKLKSTIDHKKLKCLKGISKYRKSTITELIL